MAGGSEDGSVSSLAAIKRWNELGVFHVQNSVDMLWDREKEDPESLELSGGFVVFFGGVLVSVSAGLNSMVGQS